MELYFLCKSMFVITIMDFLIFVSSLCPFFKSFAIILIDFYLPVVKMSASTSYRMSKEPLADCGIIVADESWYS